MQCKTCRHYHFYQKIRSSHALFAHRTEMPCKTCKHFSLSDDNYEPALTWPVQDEISIEVAKDTELKTCVECKGNRIGNFCNICGNILISYP